MPVSTSRQSQRTNNINAAQTASDQAIVQRVGAGGQFGGVQLRRNATLNQYVTNEYSGLNESQLAGILERLRPGDSDSPANSAPLPFADPITESVTNRIADQVTNAPDEARRRVTLGILAGAALLLIVIGVGAALVMRKQKRGTK